MPVAGLVITLMEDAADALRAIAAMEGRRELTVGERSGRWVAVALEADDDAGCREVHDWLGALPGVAFVDVVSVEFSGESPVQKEASNERGS